jgi:protein-S-isoprenylcysteine O-methyltransferase Ste14
MHTLPGLIAICAFIAMGMGYIVTIFRILGREGGLWGNPSIHPVLFYSGKITMFLCWALALIKAIFPDFGWLNVPVWMSWTGSVFLCIATLVLLLSFYNLGSSLRYGLPGNETKLKTTGLYRFSRHPLYMGVLMVTASSVIFFPHILNILIGLYCIATHYMMISAEEKFLAERFGTEWKDYKDKVRRYL